MVEVFWLLQPDVAGDSSTETTVLLKSLEVAEEILNGRKTEVPKHLVLEALPLMCVCSVLFVLGFFLQQEIAQVDNCSREHKNQIFLKTSALMTCQAKSLGHIIEASKLSQ